MNLQILEKYKHLLGKRYETFLYVFSKVPSNAVILELGTSRSFVNSRFPGCSVADIKYWDENNIQSWDWGAGIFTRICAEVICGTSSQLITVDPSKDAIYISKTITNRFSENIFFFQTYSTSFLQMFCNKVDCVYMDHGETGENSATLHLQDSELLITRGLLNDSALILIDDTNFSDGGKGKYSIPFFLNNGCELVKHGYQTILRRKLN